jgi:alpha-D-ribose 1-methylphosphonate 5-triphosphate synthase subunit PhnH
MTLLSHFSDPLHTSGRSLRAYRHAEGAPAHPGAAEARLAAIRRLLGAAFAILLAAGALTGIIALKTAIYLSHLNY